MTTMDARPLSLPAPFPNIPSFLLVCFLDRASVTELLGPPIALRSAEGLGASADAFLMAVAIGGSCAFLTPVGHQNNTLILGPGGYRFGDYWRMGLPLEILIVAISVPAILVFWPL